MIEIHFSPTARNVFPWIPNNNIFLDKTHNDPPDHYPIGIIVKGVTPKPLVAWLL